MVLLLLSGVYPCWLTCNHSPAKGVDHAVGAVSLGSSVSCYQCSQHRLLVAAARCVAMLADMYHSPAKGVDNAVGTATLGSSEAIMLAGLAMKKRWQARMEAQGKPTTKPNLVMGYNVQVIVLVTSYVTLVWSSE